MVPQERRSFVDISKSCSEILEREPGQRFLERFEEKFNYPLTQNY